MSREVDQIFIVGETATGKSGLAMQIAQQYNGEIICADSVTCYKKFNIGSAKPTPLDTSLVAHHMLDIAQADTGYSVAEFSATAKPIVRSMISKNRLPVIVGGSGLYVDSLLKSYTFGSPKDLHLRQELEAMPLEKVQEIAKQYLSSEDSNQIDWNNYRRLIRIIENEGIVHESGRSANNATIIGLFHETNAIRRRAIEERVEKMFKQGLRREVDDLQALYGWDSEPMKSIGYKEFKAFYAGKHSMSRVKREIVKSTLKLAKNQRSWFKRYERIQRFTDTQQAYNYISKIISLANPKESS